MIDNIRSREEKSQAVLRASRYWMQKVQQPVWWLTQIQYLFTLCCCRRAVPGALGGSQCTAMQSPGMKLPVTVLDFCKLLYKTFQHNCEMVVESVILNFQYPSLKVWINNNTEEENSLCWTSPCPVKESLFALYWKEGVYWYLSDVGVFFWLFLIYTCCIYIATNVMIKWKAEAKSKASSMYLLERLKLGEWVPQTYSSREFLQMPGMGMFLCVKKLSTSQIFFYLLLTFPWC